ncbi:MAG: acetoin utilization protein AcuC [Actinomycetota bacterium]|nr:acetoin utilization protein AcuC [Actinomycetota bacterium]
MSVRTGLVWSADVLGYDFGPTHPMSPVRLDLTMSLVRELGLLGSPGLELIEPFAATDTELVTVHSPEFVRAVREASEPGAHPRGAFGLGSGDVPAFEGMHEASARIVGGSRAAALAVWRGELDHGVNVSGGLHHAMPAAASGFCVYNDIAVAVRALLDAGAQRVAYIDIDAHHGDGVENVFWDDPRVLTVSVHESGRTLFPGTGYPQDCGGPGACGTAVNVALPAGTTTAGWARAIEAVVPAVVRAFAPDVIVSQHGCDAHALDPLTNLRVSVDGFRWAAGLVHGLAHEVSGGRWLALGGGGYAVVDVVPRAWALLVAEAAHAELAGDTPLPAAWLEQARRYGHAFGVVPGREPSSLTDGETVEVRGWASGYDPANDVDRAVRATRRAVFPHLGLDVELD